MNARFGALLAAAVVLAAAGACGSDIEDQPGDVADLDSTVCTQGACPGASGIALVKSSQGNVGDFEVIAPRPGGGVARYHRDNDSPSRYPGTAPVWDGPDLFGTGEHGAAAAVENRNTRRLEVVVRQKTKLLHYSRAIGSTGAWDGPVEITSDAQGTPGLVQSFRGSGSLELVAPKTGGGIGHYYQERPGAPWRSATSFGTSRYAAAAVAFDDAGHLFVVARSGGTLVAWDDSGNGSWRGPTTVIRSGVTGLRACSSPIATTSWCRWPREASRTSSAGAAPPSVSGSVQPSSARRAARGPPRAWSDRATGSRSSR